VALVLDTSVVYASLDRADFAHKACRRLLNDTDEPLVIPAPVLVEVDYFVRRIGVQIQLQFLADIIEGAFEVVHVRASEYVRIRELCAKYSDQNIGLVDASIVAIAERLNEPKIATLDRRHFGVIRPRHVDAFNLLPELTPS
jgi:predicted nucleic acid-binding protein